jgi:hypothetical protein
MELLNQKRKSREINPVLLLNEESTLPERMEVNLSVASLNLDTSAPDPEKDDTRDGADDTPGGSYDQPYCGLREQSGRSDYSPKSGQPYPAYPGHKTRCSPACVLLFMQHCDNLVK